MLCRLPSYSSCWDVVCSETSAPAAATASVVVTSTANKCGLKKAQSDANWYSRSARSTAKPAADRQKDPLSCKTCGHLRNVEPFAVWHRGFKRQEKPKCRAPI